MPVTLKLTKLSNLNDAIVIKQEGGHFFIAAQNSFIIDKAGLLKLILELGRVGYITPVELVTILNKIHPIIEENDED